MSNKFDDFYAEFKKKISTSNAQPCSAYSAIDGKCLDNLNKYCDGCASEYAVQPCFEYSSKDGKCLVFENKDCDGCSSYKN